MAAKKRIKLTVQVDPDFYPIMQGLVPIVGLSRDDMIEQAIKIAYREEIKELVTRSQAVLDESEEEIEEAAPTTVAISL